MGCHSLLQGNLPGPGIEPRSPALQADSLPSEPPRKPNRLYQCFVEIESLGSWLRSWLSYLLAMWLCISYHPGLWLSFPIYTIWKWKSLSRARLFATPWTAVHQAPLSMRFSRQGYWSGLPFPSPGDLPNPGIEHGQILYQLSYKGSPKKLKNYWIYSAFTVNNCFVVSYVIKIKLTYYKKLLLFRMRKTGLGNFIVVLHHSLHKELKDHSYHWW